VVLACEAAGVVWFKSTFAVLAAAGAGLLMGTAGSLVFSETAGTTAGVFFAGLFADAWRQFHDCELSCVIVFVQTQETGTSSQQHTGSHQTEGFLGVAKNGLHTSNFVNLGYPDGVSHWTQIRVR